MAQVLVFEVLVLMQRGCLLINQKILKDISILNHSCAPNAAMGLLDGEENEAADMERRFELRAVKDISKEDEVTIFYPADCALPCLHIMIRETIQEDFGFDCKCPVCSGDVPNQDDIMKKMQDIITSSGIGSKDMDNMTISEWTRVAIASGAVVELFRPVYMGRPDMKLSILKLFRLAAAASRKSALVVRAVDGIKDLAEKTGLEVFKEILQETPWGIY